MDRPVVETALAGQIARIWGLLGTMLLLAEAVVRLVPLALEAVRAPLTPWQWALLVLWVVGMAYGEGVRGFQRAFSPRVVARAWHLAQHPRPAHVLLAPLFCMGLIHATRRRLITSWSVLVGVVALVLAMRGLDQPVRGIVDAGVVVGLTWGLVAMAVFTVRAASGRVPDVALDLP